MGAGGGRAGNNGGGMRGTSLRWEEEGASGRGRGPGRVGSNDSMLLPPATLTAPLARWDWPGLQTLIWRVGGYGGAAGKIFILFASRAVKKTLRGACCGAGWRCS